MRDLPTPVADVAERPGAPADEASFMADVIAGLSARPKHLLPKYFYDAAGSALFEEITELPEYYPTRTEIGILRQNRASLRDIVPDGAALIEFGSGSSTKIRILLDAMPSLAVYVPVDVSGEMLMREADTLALDYPRLRVSPVVADFTRAFELPSQAIGRPKIGFFPGSTIGNFDPPDALAFLAHAHDIVGPDGKLIVGVDLIKDEAILNAAYDDAAGVTARFNLNVLARINRELGANFDIAGFRHRAFYNAGESRVEMHLVSRFFQEVAIGGRRFSFDAGESIHTESSYKYSIASFQDLARRAGWTPLSVATDVEGLFSVHILSA